MGLASYNVLGAMGGFVSPYIVGQLSNGGSYNSSMYVQGAFNLAAALMVLGAQSACMAMSVGCHNSTCIAAGQCLSADVMLACAGRRLPGGSLLI